MVTTPIFYVNAAPHIGHLHSTLLADGLSRWFKLRNHDTLFTTGTDEHGLKVQEAAEKHGKDYQEFCDGISIKFREMFDVAKLEYDDYIRTTDKRHYKAVEQFWRRLEDNGHIYLGQHKAWYCKSDESFLTELQVQDITDDQGNVKKVSLESGHPVEIVCEENYKFRLSAFQNRLLEWLDANPDAVYPPSRMNEVRATIENGLQDISVSRLRSKIKWAIEVPTNPDHAIYVWLDALTNYLTCCGYPDESNLNKTWPADYHIVGKDILKFHAIYWPAFLMAAGLPLPKRIVSHAHWTVDRVKMSKSLQNVVDPHVLIEKYGLDAIRYFLLREGGMSNDSDFSIEQLENRWNELADTFGNLVSRSTGARFLPDRLVPACGELTVQDQEFVAKFAGLQDAVREAYEKPDFSNGIITTMAFLKEANRYFSDHEPWKLVKDIKLSDDPAQAEQLQDRLNTILFLSIEASRVSALLLQPVMPDSCDKILTYLGVPPTERTLDYATLNVPSSTPRKIQAKGCVAFPKLQSN